jgi:hypothetical protein
MFGIGKTKGEEGKEKLPEPKRIPDSVGRYVIKEMRLDPVVAWRDLYVVVRPQGKKAGHCRVFDATKVAKAKMQVKDWTSLDDHPEFIMFEGYYDDEKGDCHPEKFSAGSAS